MYIDIDLKSDRTPSLADADSFQSFYVRVRGSAGRPLAEMLTGIDGIATTGADLLVPLSTVLGLDGARPQEPEWMQRFGDMVQYASQHGWLSADGQLIQAHCEIDDSSDPSSSC